MRARARLLHNVMHFKLISHKCALSNSVIIWFTSSSLSPIEIPSNRIYRSIRILQTNQVWIFFHCFSFRFFVFMIKDENGLFIISIATDDLTKRLWYFLCSDRWTWIISNEQKTQSTAWRWTISFALKVKSASNSWILFMCVCVSGSLTHEDCFDFRSWVS